jgi:hypothetical protein
LVILNNSANVSKADIAPLSRSGNWEPLFVSGKEGFRFEPGHDNQLSIELPPLSVLVLQNMNPIQTNSKSSGDLQLTASRSGSIDDRWEISADAPVDQVPSIAFGVRQREPPTTSFLVRLIRRPIEYSRRGT